MEDLKPCPFCGGEAECVGEDIQKTLCDTLAENSHAAVQIGNRLPGHPLRKVCEKPLRDLPQLRLLNMLARHELQHASLLTAPDLYAIKMAS